MKTVSTTVEVLHTHTQPVQFQTNPKCKKKTTTKNKSKCSAAIVNSWQTDECILTDRNNAIAGAASAAAATTQRQQRQKQ